MSTEVLPLSLDAKHTAVVVIDLQKGITGRQGTPLPTTTVIANAARLLVAARTAGAQPILVHVGGAADGSDRPRPTADEGLRMTGALPPDWSDLVPELDQQPGDIGLTKRTWGAFASTDLEAQLKALGVTQVVITGVATGTGVESTARQAYEAGFNVTLAIDAMTDANAEAHHYSLNQVFPKLGETGTAHDIIGLLETRGA